MIHDLDETIKQILVKKGKLNPSDVDIAFDQPTGEWTSSLNRPTINLYLYDIRENTQLRPPVVSQIEREEGRARKTYPPKRIDLSYLITVWARNPEDEHQLLWRTLHTLMQTRMIKPADTVGVVKNQLYDMPVKVALPSDAVRNMPDLWGVMENQLKPSINLLITVALDIELAIEAPLVFTPIFRIGQGDPSSKTFISRDVTIYHIGGRVLVRDVPIGAGASVTLLNRGDSVETDAEGRFIFASVQPGEYDIEVAVEGRQPKRHKISVPAKNYDLSL